MGIAEEDIAKIKELRSKGLCYKEILKGMHSPEARSRLEERVEKLEQRTNKIDGFKEELESWINKFGSEFSEECGWVKEGYCTRWGWNEKPSAGAKKMGERWCDKKNPMFCLFCTINNMFWRSHFHY
jgi:hypothetical protein